jgi:DNA-binding transcriptional LysR family regulator
MAGSQRQRRPGIRNWEDLRYILTVARCGSYAAAARSLRREHSTVRRRVEAAQRALGVRLFERSQNLLKLTEPASRIIDTLANIDQLTMEIEQAFAGIDDRLAGAVRITTSEGFATNWLIPRLVRFQRENPLIMVDVDAGSDLIDLSGPSADIAIRFVRPTQSAAVVAKVGRLSFLLFAARGYINTFGRPTSMEQLATHRLVVHEGFTDNPVLKSWTRYAQDHQGVVFRSNSSAAFASAVIAGFGIGLGPAYTGLIHPELERLAIPSLATVDVYLVTHATKRRIPRVAAAFEYIHEAFQRDRKTWFPS